MQTRRNKLVYYIFALAAACIVFTVVRNTIKLEELRNPSAGTLEKQKKEASKALEQAGYTGEMGDTTAPNQVVVLMKATDEEQVKTLRLLTEYVKQHLHEIHLVVFSMDDEQAMQQAVQAGIQVDPQMGRPLASIVINKETTFTIKDTSGKERSVTFQKRPNTAQSTYNSEDVITVLEQKTASKN